LCYNINKHTRIALDIKEAKYIRFSIKSRKECVLDVETAHVIA